MSRTSNTFNAVVQAAQANALVANVNAMSPGTWLRANGTGLSPLSIETQAQAALYDVRGVTGGDAESIIPFYHKGAWNPVHKRCHFVGCTHLGAGDSPYMWHAYYEVPTNTWVNNHDSDAPFSTSVAHGYDHQAVNQVTGDLYCIRYNTRNFYRRGQASGSWVQLADRPYRAGNNITWGCDWWSGSLSGLAGNQGAFVFFNPSYDGEVSWYDPVNDNWNLFSQGWNTNNIPSDYHEVCAYSPTYNCLCGGGWNANSTDIWRVNSDRTVNKLTNTPAPYGIGRGKLVCDPQSGKFLLASYTGAFYEFVPTPGNGTWTQLTGARALPANVYNSFGAATGNWGSAAVSIPAHDGMVAGVTMWIAMNNGSLAGIYLYRHA